MEKREISCCFTGHRPHKLPWVKRENDERCIALKEELAARLEGIYEYGCRYFYCGMALGCDTYFAEAVLELKDCHGDVQLEAAIPCRTQADKWSRADKERYERILRRCDKITVLQEEYTPDCMQRRNRYMVDNSSVMLACYDGRPGGTMSTLLYAQRQGVQTIIIEI